MCAIDIFPTNGLDQNNLRKKKIKNKTKTKLVGINQNLCYYVLNNDKREFN